MRNTNLLDQIDGSEIAIIGMALRLPGASTPESFWANLREGIESVVQLSEDELIAAGVRPSLLQDSDYVRACVPLDGFDRFDAPFFGFSPKDASIMDPQHRIFLECAWEAVENAGYDPDQYDGSIGVYAGCGMNAYMMYNLLSNPELMESAGEFLIRHTGNDKDFLTTRVSYNLNLRGPSVNVQTACSTSLVAAHLACQSLLNNECDIALAGGVTINLPQRVGYLYRFGEVLSPDGHCRAFDAESAGTIFGSGAGIVVLKRLKDALLDGDTIHAIIKGSAINNDGSMKVGYMAPSVEGQAKAIAEAMAVSGIEPETIGYIEAHGTGTAIGDPIEIAALTQAFETDRRNFCAIASLKTNIGHLDTAAGVAGLIKATLVLRHKAIPASLNFRAPNPKIDFANSPFYVPDTYREWRSEDLPRRAGVSSLGVGGTNAHVILEEAPELEASGPSRPHQLIVLSARTESALDAATANLAEHLRKNPGINLADAAYTLQIGRKAFERRRTLVCGSLEEAIEALTSGDLRRVHTSKAAQGDPYLVFMFPGGGAQYPNMGIDLYRSESVYRDALDRCFELLAKHLDYDLKSLIFPSDENLDAARSQLERPLNSVLSVFITEYALAQLWMSWGIRPAAMTGHSLGEYTAACLAEVLSLEDAISMVVYRGRLFEQMPAGAMLSVALSEAEVRARIGGSLSIASSNAPSLTVVSGQVEEINRIEERLSAEGVECSRVKISVAAHSSMLDPFLSGFSGRISSIKLRRPSIPFVSNMSGEWITAFEATDSDYWARQLRHTVRFADGISRLLERPDAVFIEVGPGTTLSSLVRQQPQASGRTILSSMPHPNENIADTRFIQTSLGRLWTIGQRIDWRKLHESESRSRIPLPAYPFERERYWIEPGTIAAGSEARSLTKRQNISDWFYRPVWKEELLTESAPEEKFCWLVFSDQSRFSSKLLERLAEKDHAVNSVTASDQFSSTGDGRYSVNPSRRQDYDALINHLAEQGSLPHRILYLWPISREKVSPEANLDRCFYGLLHLAQALGELDLPHPVHISIVSAGLQQVGSERVTCPERAVLFGPGRVIAQEYPSISCASIDIELSESRFGHLAGNRRQEGQIIDQLIAETTVAPSDEVVALRRRGRCIQRFESEKPSRSAGERFAVKDNDVWLITGGLGGIGLVMAEMLAQSSRCKLVLISRQGLPDRDQWSRWLDMYGDGDEVCARIATVQRLEAVGAEVFIAQADVADYEQMKQALSEARKRFGPIRKVIHAAGLVDDELIQFKTRESALGVIEPKVKGALVLDELLKEDRPDLFLLFSSTSSLIGLPGQVDYAAANAFLDAFARSRSSNDCLTVSINWGIWQKVGMAARATSRRAENRSRPSARIHPLLGRRAAESPDYMVCENLLSPNEEWILDEHRIKTGEALIPGTAYLEMARAVFEQVAGEGPLVISDMTFLSPMTVADGQQKELRVILRKRGDDFEFAASGRYSGETRWREHSIARIAIADDETTRPYPLEAILQRCDYREPQSGIDRQKDHLKFGPRWDCCAAIYQGAGEALALLELGQKYRQELDTYKCHPALLDLATGFAFSSIPDYDLYEGMYVPVSYKRLVVRNGLKEKIYSHVRCREESDARSGIGVFDITITDLEGNILIDIEEFVARRVVSESGLGSERGVRYKGSQATEDDAAKKNPVLALISQGILPEEGCEAVKRIMAGSPGPQVIVSSLDLQSLIEQSRSNRPKAEATLSLKLSRPNLNNSYADARNDVERFLVKLWQELLGLERVGIYDSFFELGGHSLMAVRMFARIKKAYKSELGLATLFASPTIAQIAELIGQKDEPCAPSEFISVIPIQPQGDKPPLFCIHGVGGNIVE